MDTVEYNLNRICRACKVEAEEMFSVFETEKVTGQSSKLADMLMACASVQVEHGDGLPGSMCVQCVNQLSNAYSFKKQCESTDTALRLYIRQKDIGIKVENATNNAETDDNILDFNSIYNNEVSAADDSKSIKTEPTDGNSDEEHIHPCNVCSKKFSSEERLKLHQRKHSGTSVHKCKVCSKEYSRLGHLHRHMINHEPRRVHVCKLCNKTLTRVEHLKRHMIIHVKNKPYVCETCKRGFNRPDHLVNHVKRCKGEKQFVCEVCNKGFNREDSLQVHVATHDAKLDMRPMIESLDNYEDHYVVVENYTGTSDAEEQDNYSDSDVMSNAEWAEPEINIVEKSEGEQDVMILEPNIKYEEERLDESYESSNNDGRVEDSDEESKPLLERIKQKSLTVQEIPMKRKRGRPRKNEIRPIKVIKTEKNGQENFRADSAKYPCDVCDKVLSTLIGLEIHMRKHTGLKTFQCKICNKKFSHSNHMKRHLLSHDEYKPFGCDVCEKKFPRQEHLIKHAKIHTSDKKFECEICLRLFSRSEQLDKHKAFKHNIGEKMPTEKKFKCNICNKHFTTEKYRDTHQKAHSGERTFECKTCLKKFKSKSHLTEHTKFHNECSKKFLCSECGQRFIRNDYLVIHMRRHRGEKPFKCKYCGKGFPRTTDLTVHERYHTGEKTHLCMVCGRGFGRAYNLTVHMRTHTGEKPYQCTYCEAAFAQGNDLKAHVRRHTGERYHCDLCSEAFLMGYLLTQHKRTVHGVDVKSHIRRLHPSERVHLPNSQHNMQPNIKQISSLTQLQVLHNAATLQAQTEPRDDLQQQITLPTSPILPAISHSVSDAVA